MKKTLFILGVLLMANFASAAWSEPSALPPGGNVPAPINVGTVGQTKNGNLTINAKLKATKDFVIPNAAPTSKENGSMWLQ